jgi:hypothetical protein
VSSACVAPGDAKESSDWEAIFARPQPDMKNNPKKATYGSDWSKALKAYPELKKAAKQVFKLLPKNGFPLKKANLRIPFTRVCVPSAKGLKNGLKKGMIVGRVNPEGYAKDATSKTFYKFFFDGKNKLVAGRTGH